jgi:phospholipase D1/2
MRRPAYYNQEWRLDQILKRKAEEGVLIYVIVYREVEVSVSICFGDYSDIYRLL